MSSNGLSLRVTNGPSLSPRLSPRHTGPRDERVVFDSVGLTSLACRSILVWSHNGSACSRPGTSSNRCRREERGSQVFRRKDRNVGRPAGMGLAQFLREHHHSVSRGSFCSAPNEAKALPIWGAWHAQWSMWGS